MKIIEQDKIFGSNGNSDKLLTELLRSETVSDHGDQLTCELVNTEEGFDALEMEWNELVFQNNNHIFQSFEWNRIWWKHFGSRFSLYLILFRDQNRLIGIAPFYVDKTSLIFKFSYWRLRFIGNTVPSGKHETGTFMNYGPTDYLDIIAHKDYEKRIARMLLLHLEKAEDQFNEVEMDEVSEDSFVIRQLIPEMHNRGWGYGKIKKELCYRIRLPKNLDDYLQQLPAKTRYEFRHTRKAVEEKGVFQIASAHTREEVLHAFHEFVGLHQKRWNRKGFPGTFANRRFKNFLEEITMTFYEKGWLRIKRTVTDGQCLAVDYAFRFNNRVYDYQKALDDSSPLKKYGPGRALVYAFLEESMFAKDTVFDMLRGDECYKAKISNEATRNWLVTIPDRAIQKNLRYRLFSLRRLWAQIRKRTAREWLILKIHIHHWGFFYFFPWYSRFQAARFGIGHNEH